MSKTPFSSKCFILGSLWFNYREVAAENDAWKQFFDYNDLGLPMSYMIAENIVKETGDGQAEILVGETWDMLCEYIDVDSEAQYESIDDLFAASPMPPLEQDDE